MVTAIRDFITTHEAAIRAGKTPDVIRAWLRAGKLGGQFTGKVWLVDPADLARVLAER